MSIVAVASRAVVLEAIETTIRRRTRPSARMILPAAIMDAFDPATAGDQADP